ncbi:MAG TPA: phytanoyl-CoA dioxygenase family protein [Alphaproteobacteria bacterium]|nr:phytanoyl-CoA dioxygenase family protein [Alphaproteobacteria bacterium]
MIELTRDQIEQFRENGFLIVDRLLDPSIADRVAARYEPLFRGEFETGIEPDEWNWRQGRDAPDRARQICNGWKADFTIASIVLRAEVGRACALLAGWPGARVQVDNVLWKPPGAKSLGFHQDCSYLEWLAPQEMLSCWIALDDTTAEGGTMELVRGSHKWGKFPMAEQFHAPEDYRKDLHAAAARIGKEPEFVPVVVPKGGGSFHHGWTWHGSGPNLSDRPRRSLVTHCVSSEAHFVPERIGQGTGRWYGKYMRHDGDFMDDQYFPILWTRTGGRSKWIDNYVRRGSAAAIAA